VVAARWPRGFECPVCGGKQYSLVTTRNLYQCTKCRRQTSPIAGTIFASTHLPLRLWFRAIYHLTQTKQGISSIELGRRLGVTQNTAWKVKHKLKQVMLERDATKITLISVVSAPAASGVEGLGAAEQDRRDPTWAALRRAEVAEAATR
jgi:transposase-like protein